MKKVLNFSTPILFIIVIIISSLVLYPVLNLALFGDDWLTLWRYEYLLGPRSSGEWSHITYFYSLYGPQDILFGLLQKLFKFQSEYYHIISYTCRLLAAFSIFPLAFYLTKNKLASFFAVLFFAITPIGFDTTNWVFNMPSYLSITCLNIFLFLFLKSRQENRYLFLSGVFYFLANILAPIRMSGALLIITLVEGFNLLLNRSTKILKKTILRLTFIILITLIVIKTGSLGTTGGWNENIVQGVTTLKQEFSNRRSDFLSYPFITLGSMIIPDNLLKSNPQIIRKSELILTLLLPSLIIFTLIITLFNKFIVLGPIGSIVPVFLSAVLLNLIIMLLHIENTTTFSGGRNIILLIIGGYTIIVSIFTIFKYFKKQNISQAIFLSLLLILLTFFVAWWRSPTTIYETTHRYLIISAAGISLLLATFIALGQTLKARVVLFSLATLILCLHIFSTRLYIEKLTKYHGKELSNKIWSDIPYYKELAENDDLHIFYFTSTPESSPILHNVITFGFDPHMALLYNRREWNVVAMDNLEEVRLAVKDGSSFKRFGLVMKPVPIDRVYAFHLQSATELINKTEEIRNQLRQSITN